MPTDWPTPSVRDLVAAGVIERPMDGNHGELHPKTTDFVDLGIPFVMASDLKDGRVDTVHCAHISEELARTLRKGFAKEGDVLLSHKATMGRTALVGKLRVPFLMLTPQVTYYRVRDQSRLDARYLKFYFDGPQFQGLLVRWANKGSTRAYLGITAQLDLPICLPPIRQQREIAFVLGALEDKIDLNRRTSETLEDIARALFKSWFVDFDPVHANADRQPGRLNPATASLFPNTFEHTISGLVPSGWAVRPLDAVAQFLNGLALQNYPADGPSFLPVIKIAQLRSMTPKGGDKASRDIPEEYIIHDGDLLFSWSGSLEVVVWYGGDGALNQHLFKVTSRYPQWFIYGWLLEHLPEFRAIAAAKATTMGHIQRRHLTEAAVVVPPDPLLNQLDTYMSPLQAHSLSLRLESRTLSELRDALLPKLLSGEVRVRDAEREVAAAV